MNQYLIRFYNRLAGDDCDTELTPGGLAAKRKYNAAVNRRRFEAMTPERRKATRRRYSNRYWNRRVGVDRDDIMTPEARELLRAYYREQNKKRRTKNA